MDYKIELKLQGKKYKGEGETFATAVAGMGIRNPKGAAVLSVAWGERKIDKILSPFIVSKLFSLNSKLRDMYIKKYSLMFKL